MSTVFLSYAREDEAPTRRLGDALRHAGFSVAWDRQVPPGKTWDDVIGKALDTAGCVIVLWSKISIHSRWVREEAERAAARECLIPVLIEKVEPPFGFGRIQAADLTGWHGDERDEQFQELVAAVSSLAGAPAPPPQAPVETRADAPVKVRPLPTLGWRRDPRRRRLWYGSLGVVAATIVGIAWWSQRPVKTGYRSLQATVTAVQFFESGVEAPPLDQRVFAAEFQQGSVRYVNWQLSFAFPPAAAPTTFLVNSAWYGPGGNLEWRDTCTVEVPAQARDLTQWRGWGQADGFRNIPLGRHTVVLSIEGGEVARGSFRVVPAGPRDTGFSSLNATITSIRFFESGNEAPPIPQRTYASEFRAGSTRFINWQLDMAFPTAPTYPHAFAIVATWYGPDGNVEWRRPMPARVEAGWPTFAHEDGWGRPDGFEGATGTHTVILTIDGSEVARGSFRFLPAQGRARLELAPQNLRVMPR